MKKKTIWIIVGITAFLGASYYGYQVWLSSQQLGTPATNGTPAASVPVTLPQKLDMSLIHYYTSANTGGYYGDSLLTSLGTFLIMKDGTLYFSEQNSTYDSNGNFLKTGMN